jgi:hypothetical protein
MVTSVHELDLPVVDTGEMEREHALVVIAEAREHH